MKPTLWISISLTFLLLASTASAENWPAWRGPQQDGISQERDLPTEWSSNRNIRWKLPLPAPGNSTPIIWQEHVFLTQSLEDGKRRAVIAMDRKSGRKLWQREVACPVEETTHRQNPPCSSSPVTDGKAVYAHFFSAGVVAYDFDGNQLWQRDLGPVVHVFGNGSSPVLYQDLLILFHGPGEPSQLMALDKRTGETVWTSVEPGKNHNLFGTWSTPLVLRGDRDELIMPLPGERVGGPGWFKSYDPATGKLLWRCEGLGNEIYAMAVPNQKRDLIVGICGHKGPTMAVRPGGSGDVTQTHSKWRVTQRNPQRVGSAVIHRAHVYLSDADGFVECLSAETGEVVWKERVGGNLWGSLLLADDKLYVSNLEGDTYVLAVGPEFQLLAKNSLGETMYAAPAVSQGSLYLRTHQHLFCVGGSQ